jgi:hypothetical protein
MKRTIAGVLFSLIFGMHSAQADFGGPIQADNAASPDGKLVVRIVEESRENQPKEELSHLVRFYEFDATKDIYERRSEFRLKEWPGELLFISNAGDLVMISLSETDAIRLYARDGKLVKTWGLNELLIPSEIKGCAQTGSTLQWFDEGAFIGRKFHFNGPAHRIRALRSSFTVMRGAHPKVSFSGLLDAETGTIRMNKPKEP